MDEPANHSKDTGKRLKAGPAALKIAVVYLLAAGAWIFFSDELLALLVPDAATRVRFSILKGFGFVLVTGGLLYLLLRRLLKLWEREMEQRAATVEILRRTDTALHTLSDCNQALVRATSEPDLLKEICRIIIGRGGYRMCWVGFAEDNPAKTVRVDASAGDEEGFLEKARITWSDQDDRGRGPTGISIRTGETVVCNDYQNDERTAPWREGGRRHGYLSSVTIPLKHAGRNFGVLVIYSGQRDAFDAAGVQLLQELADDLAYGIHSLRARAERQKAEADLAVSEERFRQIAASIEDVLYGVNSWDKEFSYVNPVFERMLGYTLDDVARMGGREEFLAQVIQDGKFEEQRSWFRQLNSDSAGSTPRWQAWWRCKDGSLKFIEDFWLPVYSNGGLQYTYGVLRDITGRKVSEQKLRESEERYRALFDRSLDCVFLNDFAGNFLDANQAALDLLGYRREDIARLNFASLLTEDQLPLAFQVTEEVIRTGRQLKPAAFRLRGRDGRQVDVETFSSLIYRDGKPYAIQGIARDMTERRAAEAVLRSSEERFRRQFELHTAIKMIIDPGTGDIVDANAAAAAFYGWPVKQLRQMRIQDINLLPPAAVAQQLARADAARSDKFEFRHRRADGSIRDVEVFTARIEAAGKVHIHSIVHDITERKQAEQTLRLHSEILENLVDGVYLLRAADLTIVYANPAFERMFGYASGELIGRHVASLNAPTDESPAAQAQKITQILQATGKWAGEIQNVKKDGTVFWCYAHVRQFEHPQFGPVMISSHADITEHKRAEEKLRASEEKFRHLFDGAADAVCVHDAQGRIRDVNQVLCEVLGYTRGELLQMSVADIETEVTPDKLGQLWEQVKGGRTITVEGEHRRRDGSTFPVEVRVTAFAAAAGEAPLFYAAGRDITEHKRAQAALVESEWRFRDMLQNIPAVAIQGYGYDGVTHYWNSASERLYGYTAEEAIGRNLLDLIIPPEMRTGVRQAIRQMAETGQLIPASELSLMRKDGSRVAVFSCHTVVRVPGRLPELFCVDIDLTERRRAEQALRESEENYQLLFRTMLDGFAVHEIICDAAGRPVDYRFLSANPAFERLTGLRVAEVVGRTVREVIPDTEPMWIERYGKVALTGEPLEFEEYSSALQKHFEVAAFCPKPGQFATVFIDITERKRAEEINVRLATAVEQATDTVVITDTSGMIIYVNPAFERTSGYVRAEVIGQNPRMLKSGKQDAVYYRQMWETLQSGRVWAGHFVNKRKDGKLYEEDVTISPLRNQQGEITNFVAVKRDVSHEVELEGQLRQSQKMEAIGTLAGGIAHDFNNILTVMFGYCNLLQLDLAQMPESLAKLAEILKAGERAKDLVQQILTFSRQREQERQVIHLHNVLNEAVKLLRASFPANLRIEMNLAPDAPAVLADATQIYQVMMNLGTNALHAMSGQDSGRLTVALDAFRPDEALIRLYPDLRPIAYARLTVADTGHGMDARTLERIFDPFFTTKPVGKGTGLGLAVVHGIVESHDGVITVESQPGQGAVFRLYFPEQVQDMDMFLKGIPESKVPCGNGQRVLVVDDEVPLAGMYQRLLKALGYKGSVKTSPHEALALVRKNPAQFDLVVTDLTMPEMNGLELARQIRALRADLPIILATGFKATVTDRQLQDAGISQLLDKPIPLTTLAITLHDVLGKK